jgi:gliding motility-associated-like protein
MKTFLLLVFVVFNGITSNAQLCNGSLGDPVINITFGTKSQPVRPHGTTLQYVEGCPGKEQYTLKNLVFGCGDNHSWLTVAGDHTLDVGGNYMLVDGENYKNTVHTDTAYNLCSNITYVYSAWVTNVLRPISCDGHPQLTSLTFTVRSLSGNLIGSYNTSDIPKAEDKNWKQYGFAFQLPVGVSTLVLSITIDEKRGCGSAFAIDDITLSPCGVNVQANINGSANDMKVCADDMNPYILQGTFGPGLINPSVQWQNSSDTGKTWNDIPSAITTTYLMPHRSSGVLLYRMLVAEKNNIQSSSCRFASNAIWTQIFPAPLHMFPQKILGCLGKDLLLPLPDPSANSNVWTGPNGYTSTLAKAVVPGVQLKDTGLYTLQENFSFGCTRLDSFYLNIYPATTISTPTLYPVCEGQTVHFLATGDGSFHWEPSTGLSNPDVPDPVLIAHDTTEYKVTVTNSFGCKDSALVLVNVFRNPEAFAGRDKTIVVGDSVVLNGLVKGTDINFHWSPSSFINDVHSLNPKVAPPFTTQYTLMVTSNVGCRAAEAKVNVLVYKDIFIPNVFTPNNDGKNDYFKIIAADGYTVKTFEIFNRWGQTVYTAKEFSTGWDGSYKNIPQATGTYVYFLQLKASSGKLITKKGTITLIR